MTDAQRPAPPGSNVSTGKQRQVVSEWLQGLQEMQAKGRDINWIALACNIAEAVIANAPVSEKTDIYQEMWEKFVSLQSGDAKLLCKAAERYHWLRANGEKGVYVIRKGGWKQGDNNAPIELAQGEELDIIIDEHLSGERSG